MAGRKRNNEEASPIGCEGEDYVLKGSTNSELLYNAVRWIGMILQVSDGKGWNTALTNTQIAATMDLAVFDAISDKFPKKEPEQFSVSAKRLLDMMLSKGQKAALEILHEMKALFTKPDTHLRDVEKIFLEKLQGLIESISAEQIEAKADTKPTKQYTTLFGQIQDVAEDDKAYKMFEHIPNVGRDRALPYQRQTSPVFKGDPSVFSRESIAQLNPGVGPADEKFMDELFEALQCRQAVEKQNHHYLLGGPTKVTMECMMKILKKVNMSDKQRLPHVDWNSLIPRLKGNWFHVTLRAVKDGDTIYYKLEGGNHGNLLYGHIYTFANVVNNKTGTVIHLPKSWWEVIYIYTHGALTIQEGDEERTTSVTNQDRLALPQPTGNTPGSESEGGKATKIVFGMSPQTPYQLILPEVPKISGLPTSKQHERIAIHIRQTYKRRMVSSPTMPDILHSVIAHFFRLTTMSVPSANPRLTSMRRPSGPVILLCYGQWPFSSAVWTPYPFCGHNKNRTWDSLSRQGRWEQDQGFSRTVGCMH